MAEVIDKVYKAGGRYSGNPDVVIKELNGSNKSSYNAVVDWGAYELVPTAGAKPEPQKVDRIFYEITLQREGDKWIMKELVSDS